MNEIQCDFVKRLDKPGLYVFRVNQRLSEDARIRIRKILENKINEHIPGSEVIVLDSNFGPVCCCEKLVTEPNPDQS